MCVCVLSSYRLSVAKHAACVHEYIYTCANYLCVYIYVCVCVCPKLFPFELVKAGICTTANYTCYTSYIIKSLCVCLQADLAKVSQLLTFEIFHQEPVRPRAANIFVAKRRRRQLRGMSESSAGCGVKEQLRNALDEPTDMFKVDQLTPPSFSNL